MVDINIQSQFVGGGWLITGGFMSCLGKLNAKFIHVFFYKAYIVKSI